MAFNIRSGGDHQEVPVPATVKGGDVVVLGDITGVAELGATLRDDGQYWTTVALEGVAYLPMEVAPSELGVAVYVTETSGEVAELGAEVGAPAVAGAGTARAVDRRRPHLQGRLVHRRRLRRLHGRQARVRH